MAKGTYKPANGIGHLDTATFDTSFVMKQGVSLSFLSSRGSDAGGIANQSSSPTITHCVFQNNLGGLGSAMLNFNGSAPTISFSRFTNNKAPSGTGIYEKNSSSVYINSIFDGNIAQYGGGAAYIQGANVTFNNCVFLSNSSAASGGAIYSLGSKISIVNSTFSSNSARYMGGAVYFESARNFQNNAFIQNSIFWGNSTLSTDGSQIAINPDSISRDTIRLSYSDLQGGVASIFKRSNSTIVQGLGIIQTTPQFLNTSNFSGPDGKYFTRDDGLNLTPGSPAINAGDQSTSEIPTTDITGAARVQGGRVDMGAYEQ